MFRVLPDLNAPGPAPIAFIPVGGTDFGGNLIRDRRAFGGFVLGLDGALGNDEELPQQFGVSL